MTTTPETRTAAASADWPYDVDEVTVTLPRETDEVIATNLTGTGASVAVVPVGERPTVSSWRPAVTVDGKIGIPVRRLGRGAYYLYARSTAGAVRRVGSLRIR